MDIQENAGQYVETVRSLHQTVIALRIALEESKKEILELKTKAWSGEYIEQSLTALAIENHALRRKLLSSEKEPELKPQQDSCGEQSKDTVENPPESLEKIQNNVLDKKPEDEQIIENEEKKVKFAEKPQINRTKIKGARSKPSVRFHIRRHKIKASFVIKARISDSKKKSRSLESLTVVKTPEQHLNFTKTTSFFDLHSEINCNISSMDEDKSKNQQNCNETEQEPECDDIELIFTTDDTKESDFKEQLLVSIDSVDGGGVGDKLLAPDRDQSLDISDRELDDDVFDSSFDQENQENSVHCLQLHRDHSQLYNSRSDCSINQEEKNLKSYYSYQDSSFENKSMEKDESFDRFEERIRIVETDISKVGIQEVEYSGIRRNTCPNPLQYRPLLHREAVTRGLNVKKSRPILTHSNAARRESGAQTDISALPNSSWRSDSSLATKECVGDFNILPSKFPLPGSRLKLSEKTSVEARRILLSDIGFTSMVPELSRSADHLGPGALKTPVTTTYGQFLQTPDLYSPAYTSQRFTWTTTTATPSEGSHSHSRYSINPLSPPVQTRRCSAPVSPSRRSTFMKTTPSKVRFANGSLPELRGDWTQLTADSEDSTDSLVDEAEHYLRRSIDCILGTKGSDSGDGKRHFARRASAPTFTSENSPPFGWQPFLPRQSRDLKLDHWVKVITSEGKVKGGRVRYIGPVANQTEIYVGVQLAVPEGHSDGIYNTRRYFQCEPYHGIFVSFRKVVMGWRP